MSTLPLEYNSIGQTYLVLAFSYKTAISRCPNKYLLNKHSVSYYAFGFTAKPIYNPNVFLFFKQFELGVSQNKQLTLLEPTCNNLNQEGTWVLIFLPRFCWEPVLTFLSLCSGCKVQSLVSECKFWLRALGLSGFQALLMTPLGALSCMQNKRINYMLYLCKI